MSNGKMIAIGAVVLVLLFGCGTIFSFQSANNTLLQRQQTFNVAKGNFGGGVTFMTQKIDAVYTVMQESFDAETLLQTGVAEARSGYQQAVQTGDPIEITNASSNFIASVKAVVENPPTTGFAGLGADTQREISEAYNQLYTLLADMNQAAGDYNVYRRSLFMPLLAGNFMGFPQAYDTYELQEIPASFDAIVGDK